MNYKLTWFLLFFISSVTAKAQIDITQAITHAQNQTKLIIQEVGQAQTPTQPDLLLPRSLTSTNELKLIPAKDWTSGFFPGNLWFLYEYTQDPYWLTQAQSFTSLLAPEQFNTETHDVGFKIYSSYGAGYRLTQSASYRNVIIQAAKSLATRFNPKVGCIQSWDSSNKWPFPVIIDNLMNLELLFAATRLTGDSTFYRIADSHAATTLKNHFRADYSSWHVVDYDPVTGQVRQKNTHQGYSDQSAWARGQAWGLYGYTMCYRETKNPIYLIHAQRIASFILNHPRLPTDLVPYWDYDAPLIPNEPRDASAAAIMASALYELSTYSSQGSTYRAAADKIVTSLANLYTSPKGENRGFILLHSTGHKPAHSEIDAPLIYADYYYLEALLRKKETNIAPQLNGISNRTINVGQNLSFTATTSDANANQIKTYSLVNAPAGATIHSATGAFSWTPTQAGTFTFFVQVTDNGSPMLADVQAVTITVTPIPTYTLTVTTIGSGTVTKSPNQASYTSGSTVTLTATPASGFQFTGWSDDAAGTTNPLPVSMTSNKTIVAQFTAVAGQQVVSFNLINADSNQPISTITNNFVLNLVNLPDNLNIQAITNPTTVGSVVFNLSGAQVWNSTESRVPYTLFGDSGSSSNVWVPVPGNYTLTATPYSAPNGGGTAGTPLIIPFSMINSVASSALAHITAYPTPTSNGYIQVNQIIPWEGKITYILKSTTGAQLTTGEINLTEPTNTLKFDFSSQMSASGVYYLQIVTEKQKSSVVLMRL
ncbi:InlB B-repeat-containing protein [Adhaeribacter radiodurans]|uniref:Glycoside hydrolase family 88 protein n=1 Tax=Adhaeribacter radiodurans TaxID=2745197 RepID=A0A7L7L1V6_9BACT|nr:putative Ig domain-containing protein [Adhaeribacter radiodurans]QMU26764.1 glycoside hydrolase family 88 protein [Adhaeribacter radiodurans]